MQIYDFHFTLELRGKKENKWGSFLTQATNYENTGSISFTEGSSTLHMKEEYGTFRLDFDLRNVETDRLFFSKCEYINKEEIKYYANELFNFFIIKRKTLREDLGNFNFDFFKLELDLLRKPLFIKEPKWKEEKELHFVTDIQKICDKNKYREIKNSYLFTKEVTISIYCRTRCDFFLQSLQHFHYPLCCFAIPQLRDTTFFPVT